MIGLLLEDVVVMVVLLLLLLRRTLQVLVLVSPADRTDDTVMTVIIAVAVVMALDRWQSHVNFFVVMGRRSVSHQEGRGDAGHRTTRNGIEIRVQTGYSSQGR